VTELWWMGPLVCAYAWTSMAAARYLFSRWRAGYIDSVASKCRCALAPEPMYRLAVREFEGRRRASCLVEASACGVVWPLAYTVWGARIVGRWAVHQVFDTAPDRSVLGAQATLQRFTDRTAELEKSELDR